jgi:hypothetical protein
MWSIESSKFLDIVISDQKKVKEQELYIDKYYYLSLASLLQCLVSSNVLNLFYQKNRFLDWVDFFVFDKLDIVPYRDVLLNFVSLFLHLSLFG